MALKTALRTTVACIGLILSIQAQASLKDDIQTQITANQATVEQGMATLSDNLTAAFAHRSMAPANTLGGGVGGFEMSLDLNMVDFDSDTIKQVAGNNADSDFTVSTFPVMKLSGAIGLPVVPLDIFLSYMDLGEDAFQYFSAEGKYAIIEGGTVSPAVAIGINHAQATIANAIDNTTTGVDVSVSKGLGIGLKLVPYAGLGYVSGNTTLQDSVTGNTGIQSSYDTDAFKAYVGASLQLGIMNIVGQWDQVGDYQAISGKLGFRF